MALYNVTFGNGSKATLNTIKIEDSWIVHAMLSFVVFELRFLDEKEEI